MFVIAADPRKVTLRLQEFESGLRARLRDRIASLTEQLEARVVSGEPERTGRLKRSTAERLTEKPQKITGSVRITADFAKAAAQEYGAHGDTDVRAHEMRLDHVFARLISPMTVVVAAHARHVDIAERRFLRGGLDGMRGEIEADLAAAVAAAVGDGDAA